jgi:hypothetical protein
MELKDLKDLAFWSNDWDNEDTSSDFCNQLRSELAKLNN